MKKQKKKQHMLDVPQPQVQVGCTGWEEHSTLEAEQGELQSQEDRQGFEAHTLVESP